jgi:ATP-dependent Clp protease ATP-binding subunit ClpA
MTFDNESSESLRVTAVALSEAEMLRHNQAGIEHLFLAILQEPFASTYSLVVDYQDRITEVRQIVSGLSPRMIFRKKRGLRRLPTATRDLMQVRESALEIAQLDDGPDAVFEARHLLEAALIIGTYTPMGSEASNFLKLLKELGINQFLFLQSVTDFNRSLVAN